MLGTFSVLALPRQNRMREDRHTKMFDKKWKNESEREDDIVKLLYKRALSKLRRLPPHEVLGRQVLFCRIICDCV